jgi:hypothetical protein
MLCNKYVILLPKFAQSDRLLVGITQEQVVAIMSERLVAIMSDQVGGIISEYLVGIIGIRNSGGKTRRTRFIGPG